jgi:hypothetical protein
MARKRIPNRPVLLLVMLSAKVAECASDTGSPAHCLPVAVVDANVLLIVDTLGITVPASVVQSRLDCQWLSWLYTVGTGTLEQRVPNKSGIAPAPSSHCQCCGRKAVQIRH